MFPTPATMKEDEGEIASGYSGLRWWLGLLMALAPGFAVYYQDEKFALALTAFAIIGLLNEISARLYDLCIRSRRTNLLLSERESPGFRLTQPPA